MEHKLKKSQSNLMQKLQIHLISNVRKISRSTKKVVLTFMFIGVFILLNKKIIFVYRRRDNLQMEEKCMNFINESVDQVLKLRTRREQNKMFAAITTTLPLLPLKMTKANAVFLYTYTKPNVVIKRCIVSRQADLAEDKISMELESEHVVKIYKTYKRTFVNHKNEEQMIVWIFMEYLNHRITQDNVRGNEDKIREIAAGILKGLKYIHGKGIAHLDLKISNVMGHDTKKGLVYKLIDFGFARRLEEKGEDAEVVIPTKSYGTYPYKPPEVGKLNIHGIKSDIWCLGAVVWFLSLKHMPFYFDNGEKDIQAYRAFINQQDRIRFRKGTSYALRDFVKKCMLFDRAQRPTAAKLLEHPFITRRPIMPLTEEDVESIASEPSFESSSE
jgi:calcium/calmodulin-dependent protein kinase I